MVVATSTIGAAAGVGSVGTGVGVDGAGGGIGADACSAVSGGEELKIDDMSRPPKNPPPAVTKVLSTAGAGRDMVFRLLYYLWG